MSSHSSHTNYEQCYAYQEPRGSDSYGNAKYDKYESNGAGEYYRKDAYGNSTYEDIDDYGNYKRDVEE